MKEIQTAVEKSRLRKTSIQWAWVFCLLISGAFSRARSEDFQNEAIVLKLEDALVSEKTSYLNVCLQLKNGTVVRSFGFGPWYSDMAFETDASGLTVSGSRIAGSLVVSVRKDNWPDPNDDRIIEATYNVEAELSENSKLEGSFTGAFKGNQIEGPVEGYIEDKPFTGSGDTTFVDLWIDEPLYNSEGLGKTAAIRHSVRLSAHFMVVGGNVVGAKLTQGVFRANHPENADLMLETSFAQCQYMWKTNIWDGSISDLSFTMNDSSFVGTMALSVTPGSNHFSTGDYQISFEGQIVGSFLAGTAEPRYNNTHDLMPTTIMGHISDSRGRVTVPEPTTPFDAVTAGNQNETLKEQALQEANVPVRPGVPGEQLFWNDYHLDRFGEISCIYAPAFNAAMVEGATDYRFVVFFNGESVAQFQANEPWSSLEPVWSDIPVGPDHRDSYVLSIQAVDNSGVSVGSAQTFHFRKKASYDGFWTDIPENAPERLVQNLKWMMFSPPFGPFASDIAAVATYPSSSKTGNSDAYVGWSVANAMHVLSLRSTDHKERELASSMVDRAGEWLWSRGTGPRNFPQYHWDQMYTSVWAALTFVDLYQVSPKEKWRRRALNFADAYRELQLQNGTWTWAGASHLVSYPNNNSYFTGKEPWPEFDAGEFLYFLGKVRTVLETDEYADVEQKALQWERENSAKTFFWRSHASKMSSNSGSRPERPMSALFFAQYLIDYTEPSDDDIYLIEEIARYCEDQFVVWKGIGNNSLEIPYTLDESYGSQAASKLALVYFFLHKKTGDPLHLAKAKALMNGVLATQNPNTGAIQFDYSGKDDTSMPDYHHKIAETTVNLLRLWKEMEEYGAVEATGNPPAPKAANNVGSVRFSVGSGKISVTSQNGLNTLSLYSISGRLVEISRADNRETTEISTVGLPGGFYIVRASGRGIHHCRKVFLP